MYQTSAARAFTLIELLIVVAIIAILAAIAVPNFLEAQTRSKVSRAYADMRSVDTAIQAYVVDYNNEPKVTSPFDPDPGGYSAWWGFVSTQLTTPVAYITNLPNMAFFDEQVLGAWEALGGSQSNQPYTVIRDTGTSRWPVGLVLCNACPPMPPVPIPQAWRDRNDNAGYVIYTCGPDKLDSSVHGNPQFYDPTNGTVSFGDVYRFGAGTANEDDRLR